MLNRLQIHHFCGEAIRRIHGHLCALHSLVWLVVFREEDRQAITDRYYTSADPYQVDEYNRLGLQTWERRAVERWFPHGGHVLVTGAGGGREVFGLVRMGYTAEGFESNERLAAYASRWLASEGIRAQVRPAKPSHIPETIGGRYSAILVGWASYMHITPRASRVVFLKHLRGMVPVGAPVLLSFFTRSEGDRHFRRVARVANFLRKLKPGGVPVEEGDWMGYFGEHYFTRAEAGAELAEAGFHMVHFSTVDYGHAVGIAE